MSRQEDFIEAGIQYRMKHGKPMCIAGSNLADVERDFNRVMSFEENHPLDADCATEKGGMRYVHNRRNMGRTRASV